MNVELQKQLGDKHEYTNMFQFCLPPTVLFVVPSSRETVMVTCALEKNIVRRIQYCLEMVCVISKIVQELLLVQNCCEYALQFKNWEGM